MRADMCFPRFRVGLKVISEAPLVSMGTYGIQFCSDGSKADLSGTARGNSRVLGVSWRVQIKFGEARPIRGILIAFAGFPSRPFNYTES